MSITRIISYHIMQLSPLLGLPYELKELYVSKKHYKYIKNNINIPNINYYVSKNKKRKAST